MRREDVAELNRIYDDRGYDTDPVYSDLDPCYLQRVQGVERMFLRALDVAGLGARLERLRVLDFGCGNARWLGRWLAWGADPTRLSGADVREPAIRRGQQYFPEADLRTYDGQRLPWASGSFDVVYQFLAMSSMVDREYRVAAAREMLRVLRPGGLLVWYDMAVGNPRNPNVRGLPLREVRDYFQPLRPVLARRLSLAPPLSRMLTARSWAAARFVETTLPFSRTHLFAAFVTEPAARDRAAQGSAVRGPAARESAPAARQRRPHRAGSADSVTRAAT
ncbi:class I SAM-dependent methyltransferase [Plantactinospora sp. KBS50]|uniref:class I SAM-dependent methyltransferase n=1 Tax=Plantactinospora sp. KBS50 TaxID=2024580 RepID=UPI000BAB20DF|nr:class I SAM-dependent methyltransferase [Plantactinospora sp. KBS50]ASW56890.1 hypothetical protein CIK06_26125 [Plantactinospora sp. KBS50]